MRPSSFRVLAPVALLAAAATSQAAVVGTVLVDFMQTATVSPATTDTRNGLVWNRYGSSSGTVTIGSSALANADGSGPSGFTVDSPNYRGFGGTSGRGADYNPTGSFTFPNAVMSTNMSENTASAQLRDGLSIFRFTSTQEFDYNFLIASSAVYATDGANILRYNIGGTYSKTTGNFTGGTTSALIDAGIGSEDRGYATLSGTSVGSGTNWYVELQMGYANTADAGRVAPINALKMDYIIVPEPATAALAGLASAGLILARRRQRA